MLISGIHIQLSLSYKYRTDTCMLISGIHIQLSLSYKARTDTCILISGIHIQFSLSYKDRTDTCMLISGIHIQFSGELYMYSWDQHACVCSVLIREGELYMYSWDQHAGVSSVLIREGELYMYSLISGIHIQFSLSYKDTLIREYFGCIELYSSREAIPHNWPLFHCRRGWLIRGKLL
jgi:hypothetical protein